MTPNVLPNVLKSQKEIPWNLYLALSLAAHALLACWFIQFQSINPAPPPVTITFQLEQPARVSVPHHPSNVLHATQALPVKKELPSSSSSALQKSSPAFKNAQPVSATPVSKPPHYEISTPRLAASAVKPVNNQTAATPSTDLPRTAASQSTASTAAPTESHVVAPVAIASRSPVVEESSVKARSAAKATWQGLLLGQLEKNKRYPKAARELHEEGTAYLRFSMNRHGKVLSAKIQKSTGSETLDAETLSMIQRAEPLPPPPSEIPGEAIELVVPVQFSLKKRSRE